MATFNKTKFVGPYKLVNGKQRYVWIIIKKTSSEVRCTQAMNFFFSELYASGYWIRSRKAFKLARLVEVFLVSYQRAAWLCANAGLNRFQLVPKLHMLSHVGKRLEDEAASATWCRNPLCESVQMQEDFVGKPSRVSRRVNARTVHERVISRTLVATHVQLLKTQMN